MEGVTTALATLKVSSENSIVKSVKSVNIIQELQKSDIVQTSVLFGENIDASSLVEYNAKISALFPNANPIKVTEFLDIVQEEKWTKSRLEYVYNKMRRSQYRDFQIGEFINEDKTITFGRTELALRRNLKFNITQNEIVMIKLKRTYEENGETKHDFVRAFAYKEEAEDIMPDKIVGRWNNTENCFDFCGTIENHETEIRKLAFKKSLFKFCNIPPYNGEYDVDIVKQFFEFWSQTIPPGDMMKFERFMKFDAEIALKDYNKITKQQNQN